MSVAAFKNQEAKNSKPPPPNFFPATVRVCVYCICCYNADGQNGSRKSFRKREGKGVTERMRRGEKAGRLSVRAPKLIIYKKAGKTKKGKVYVSVCAGWGGGGGEIK